MSDLGLAISDGSDIAPEDVTQPRIVSSETDTNDDGPPQRHASGDGPAFANNDARTGSIPSNQSPIPRLTLSPPMMGQSKIETTSTASSHRGSDASQRSQRMTLRLWSPRAFKAWKSPLSMTLFFLIGLGLSLAHCVFYAGLNGMVVGTSYHQEEKLRAGTAFSFLAQLALTASVWKSYTQWLWRAAYGKTWTAKGLNKAFSVDLAPSSMLSRDFIKTFKLGAVMAFFGWCLILPAFFTPAALYVYQSTQQTVNSTQVPYLAIANSSAGVEFAYSPPWNSEDTVDLDTTRIFTGPRTVVMLLATATASNGEILRIDSPSNHSAYTLDFYSPIVKCLDANDTTAELISEFLDEHMAVRKGSAEQIDSAYYSFVPATNTSGDRVAYAQPRFQEPSNATNELWMTFQRWTYPESGGERARERVWQVCRLHNATYSLQLQWEANLQNVTGTYEVGEAVDFPQDSPGEVSNMENHAYAGLFWALTDQLVGSLGWFRDGDAVANSTDTDSLPQFGAMESAIRHTSVLGSSDLDVYFDYKLIYDLYVYENEDKIQGQRMLDKILARNRTLDVLIEELSFNITVGMLHNHLLTYNTTRDVTYWSDVNKYGYQPTSLFIPYALANAVALVAVILGLVSFWRDGTYPDKSFQDIAYAAEDPHIIEIIEQSRSEESQMDSMLVTSNGTRYWLRRLSRSASVSGDASVPLGTPT